jgi:hypothetical protein
MEMYERIIYTQGDMRAAFTPNRVQQAALKPMLGVQIARNERATRRQKELKLKVRTILRLFMLKGRMRIQFK